MNNKKQHPKVKSQLHPRNKHLGRYNFKELTTYCPELLPFVIKNQYKDESINFFDPAAVKELNRALLKCYYGISFWDIPDNCLCPPIPGRADYIHYLADLLQEESLNAATKRIKCLDIGVGANCIYPLIGNKEYGWNFVGADCDLASIQSAQNIVNNNKNLAEAIEIRLQEDKNYIFKGIIKENECFDISLCNPPFHASAKEAQSGTLRKLRNLKGKKTGKVELNFGGKSNELWCEGGEKQFVSRMIVESREFATSCHWFTSLVSKETNLPEIYSHLKRVNASEVKTINMGQGNKKSRIIAWTFH